MSINSTANQLIHESSPYLLQHAYNPVNWLPYSLDVFSKAIAENKPLIISIGYSSCHWCHVMEKESFENQGIADFMNENFICVKVDREEHTEVDHVYMDAVQQIRGNGGWPLNCFTLPDGRPFWGGTYFRPDQWLKLLQDVTHLYKTRYADLELQAAEIAQGVIDRNIITVNEGNSFENGLDFDHFIDSMLFNFDMDKGGVKGMPKFPMPVVLRFLLQFYLFRNNPNSLNALEITLQSMAKGGIFDQIGGGFARYATDEDWKVPHFEKMLYDNAQLISMYSKAFIHTGDVFYKSVAEMSIEFVEREMTSSEGLFYSAIDADSQKGEGLYYTWTQAEFEATLGDYSALIGEYFGINGKGFWQNEQNILLRTEKDDLFAQRHYLSADELKALLHFCRKSLLEVREKRVYPTLDDKILTSWNALMITAYIDAYLAFKEEKYLLAAQHSLHTILERMRQPSGGLFRTYKNGKAKIDAYLDDYAFLASSCLYLFTVTTNEKWLKEAEQLTDYVLHHFYDDDSGFFWFSPKETLHTFAKKIETYDGVIPSSNAIMFDVLYQLGYITDKQTYLSLVKRSVETMNNRVAGFPLAYSAWAELMLKIAEKPYIVAVVGSNAQTLIQQLLTAFRKPVLICGSTTESTLPHLVNRYQEGKNLIYVCTENSCLQAVESVEAAVNLVTA